MESISSGGGASAVDGSSPPEAESSSMGAKRRHSDVLEKPGPAKKARGNPTAPGGQIMPPPTLIPELDDDIQCASYAIELLRVSWNVSHASGILLKDQYLEVLWYDPQGCIRTTPIDIINQLPLLVVLVQAQRRSGYVSGLRNIPVPGKLTLIDEATPTPRFQLVGRMTSYAQLGMPESSDATHFFKSSWPEDVCLREHVIIQTAITRVNTHLPEGLRPFVLDHLPIISHSSEIYNSSTAIVRTLLGLGTDGARIQYLMCSELLSNLLGIAHDFSLFRGILRDVVRAHRLLWLIGIAHGDVSFHNIMIKSVAMVGVLNDFDLAAVMEPGAASPLKIGFRRTGNPLFMATELLSRKGRRAEIPRLYRHDLESFAWVLLYASLCVKDGKENLDVEPFRDWVLRSSSNLEEGKIRFVYTIEEEIQGYPNKEWLLPTFDIWYQLYFRHRPKKLPGPEGDPELLDRVLRAWKIDKEEWEDWSLNNAQL